MKIGTIVKNKKGEWSFFAKIERKLKVGYQCSGLRNTGVNPNAIYYEDELEEIKTKDFDINMKLIVY